MDHEPRPGVRAEKSARDRLIRLAATHPSWALGFQDEVWWSRLARPSLRTWIEEGDRLRLVEHAVAKDDPGPKALACYGLLLRSEPHGQHATDEIWLRFVDGRTVSPVTIGYCGCGGASHAHGKRVVCLATVGPHSRLFGHRGDGRAGSRPTTVFCEAAG